MNKGRNPLVVIGLLFICLLCAQRTKAQVNVYANLSGGNGGITAYASASTGYQFGHLDYFEVSLEAPEGTDASVLWQHSWFGGSGGPSFSDHSINAPYRPNGYYYLSVFACASDDNGTYCSGDTAFLHTPPASEGGGGGGGGGGGCGLDCCVEPCPAITSIEPAYGFRGESGVMTITGTNLQNVTYVGPIISSNLIWTSIISTSETAVTVNYYIYPGTAPNNYIIAASDDNGSCAFTTFQVY